MVRGVVVAAMALALVGCAEAEAKRAVAEKLKDPSSAQFQNVRESGEYVCGEVNGKNSFGAYSGFRRFVAGPLGVTLEPEEPGETRDYFGVIWTARCGV